MKVFVKYFGLIKDVTLLNEELIELQPKTSVQSFINDKLYTKYPSLSMIDFRIAINNEFCENTLEILDEDNLSILPFFSGG
jgi:molybdopterin converting factor small subunit